MTVKIAEIFLVSLISSAVAVAVAHYSEMSWGILAGAAAAAIIATLQHVTGRTYLDTEE